MYSGILSTLCAKFMNGRGLNLKNLGEICTYMVMLKGLSLILDLDPSVRSLHVLPTSTSVPKSCRLDRNGILPTGVSRVIQLFANLSTLR